VLALITGMSASAIGLHIAAGVAVLVVSFSCFAFGWIGGGDAKVAASAALWFGFGYLLDYLVFASLVGGVLTLLILQFRNFPLPASLARQGWLTRLHSKDSGIPYGVALAIGALLIYPDTDWIKAIDLTQLTMR
jgi:prepilin peptidase CpaA